VEQLARASVRAVKAGKRKSVKAEEPEDVKARKRESVKAKEPGRAGTELSALLEDSTAELVRRIEKRDTRISSQR
jgi:hypothetical protein